MRSERALIPHMNMIFNLSLNFLIYFDYPSLLFIPEASAEDWLVSAAYQLEHQQQLSLVSCHLC